MTQKNIVGSYPDRSRYDLLSVILIGLSQYIAEASDEHKLHRLLETFFSSKLSENDKRKIIEEEYDITYSMDIERSVREMCNVSQGLIEIGKAEGRAEGKAEGKTEALTNLQNAILDKRKYGYTDSEELIKLGYDAETAEIAISIG
jgi:predicted transposase YdaD